MELARARATQHRPTARILRSHLDAFSSSLRKRLKDQRPEFAERYLNILVEEVVINGDEAAIWGSYDRLAVAVQRSEEAGLDQVPSFGGGMARPERFELPTLRFEA